MTFGSLPDSPVGPKDAAEPRRGQDGGGGGLRYKALGNSMAVPVMARLGGRIALCDGAWRDAAA